MVIRQEHTRLVVTSSSRIDTTARPTVFGADGRSPWRSYTSDAAAADDLSAVEFALDSPLVARSESLALYARPSFTGDIPLADGVMSLCGRIHADFTFDAKATEINTPLEEVLAMRRGVCQDFAHVMVGVDPTNNQIAGPSYITVARGRDYADVPPLKGVIFTDADESRLTVSVDVVACDNPELVASAVE
jgi:transglutaminase-like putative cysteine protease